MKLTPFDTSKVMFHYDRLESISTGNIPYPVTAEIDPSNLCNHNCIWCMYKEFKKSSPVNISRKDLLTVIAELAEVGVKSITFTGGGEPLCNPATPKAMNLCKYLGVQCGLVTNGGLIHKNLKRIAHNCTFCRVSLDAGTKTTHDLLHNPNYGRDFNGILKDIKTLKTINPNLTVGVAFLVHNENYREIELATKKVKNTGADYIQIRPVIQGITLSTASKAKELLKISYKHSDDNFKVYGIMHRFNEIFDIKRRFRKCRTTPLIASIGADLNMYICCQLRGNPDYIIGNLKDNTFKEIWGSKQHKEIINSIDINNCPVCRYIPYNEIIEKTIINDSMHRNFL